MEPFPYQDFITCFTVTVVRPDMLDHLEVTSTCLHCQSQEGQSHLPLMANLAEKSRTVSVRSRITAEAAEEDEEDEDRETQQTRRDSNASDESESGEQKKNQFSFVERETQSKIQSYKV